MTTSKSSALMLSGMVALACSVLFAQVQRPGEYPRGVKPSPLMNFFVTSEPVGDGGNLGGLAGADAHCQTLAAAAGAGNRTWHAYLSTQARPGQPAVNARDRIGTGPWTNAKGETIATDVAALHSDANNLTKATALDEKSNVINGRGDTPNRHDALTGSLPDGTAAADTCND